MGHTPNSEQENLALRVKTLVRAVKCSSTIRMGFLTPWYTRVYSTVIIIKCLKNILSKCLGFFSETTII